MKRTALILTTAVAGLVSLCAGVFAYGYLSIRDMPERAYRSQGPNAAWADHKWVAAVQPLASYATFAAALQRNRITDVYFDMGSVQADGLIPSDRYTAAPYLLREMRGQQPSLHLHAWIGQVERRAGGTLDLADAEVRHRLTATAARFLALGFDGIHFSFPGAGNGNAHLLMLLDQVHSLTRRFGSTLSLSSNALEPLPGLAWLTRKTGSRSGFWTRRYYKAVAARVDQIAVIPALAAPAVPWLEPGLVAWQTKSIRGITAGHTVLFMGVPAHVDAETASLDASALIGIRKAMGARSDDSFDNFGLALEARWLSAGQNDHALLENWLDSGDVVAR
jgi:hypothetical protein